MRVFINVEQDLDLQYTTYKQQVVTWYSTCKAEICMLMVSDVETHEIDEKSMITYISSMYDVFPEPPAIHPLYDSVSVTLKCSQTLLLATFDKSIDF